MKTNEKNQKTESEAKLDAALADIEKAFGKGAVMKLGDRAHVDVDVIPSGSLLIDAALGVGGYPKGRVIEIFGPESSGKTTLALHVPQLVQPAPPIPPNQLPLLMN